MVKNLKHSLLQMVINQRIFPIRDKTAENYIKTVCSNFKAKPINIGLNKCFPSVLDILCNLTFTYSSIYNT